MSASAISIKPAFWLPCLSDRFCIKAHSADPAHSRSGLIIETRGTGTNFHRRYNGSRTFQLTDSIDRLWTTFTARWALLAPWTRRAFGILRSSLHQHHAGSFKCLHIGDALKHGTNATFRHASAWSTGSAPEHVCSKSLRVHPGRSHSPSHRIRRAIHSPILTARRIICRPVI